MSTATYGELLAQAETALLQAMTRPAVPSAEEVADGATRLLRALAVHTQLLTPLGPAADPYAGLGPVHERAARALSGALDPARHYRPEPRAETATPTQWHAAAVSVDAAGQLLQQHLGGPGQLSTPDTIHVLDGQQRWQALARLAVIGRGAARELAHHLDTNAQVRPAVAQRLRYISEPLAARATLLLDLDTATTPATDRLAGLERPHDLTRPPHHSDPSMVLVEIIERTVLAAHRQATGERAVSRADLIGQALLASRLRALQLHFDLFPHELARAGAARSLRAWVDSQQQWQDLQVRDVSPQGTTREIAVALALLEPQPQATGDAPSPRAVDGTAKHLAALAGANTRTVTRLARASLLLQPTRQRNDVDWPHPWVKADQARSQTLLSVYRRLAVIEQAPAETRSAPRESPTRTRLDVAMKAQRD